MKWFKHETRRGAALKRLVLEYGVEGYGLYWACIELISGSISIENLTFELEEDAGLIAHEFKIDTLKVEKIMHRCIELGLFDLADTGRIRCLQLATSIDKSMIRNPVLQEIQNEIRGNQGKSVKISENQKKSCQIRLDETRLDENNNIYSQFENLVTHWNSKKLQQHSFSTVKKRLKKRHADLYKEFGEKKIKKAIDNYSIVVNNGKYFFCYKWSFWDFISRGLEKFIDESDPLNNFIKKDIKTFNERNAFLDSISDEQFEQIAEDQKLMLE